jgi:tRNA(Ile)-lysidine synthase
MALIPGTPWAAQTEVLSAPLTASVIRALRQENWEEVWRILEQPTRYTIYLDGETIGAQLLVRTRQPGDRIQPLGMTGEKKVQDVFVDNHISREERATTPLFFEDAHCLWVAGLCIDHRSRLTRNTRRIIRLSIQLA